MALPAVNSVFLKECFNNVIKGKKLSLELKEVERVISNDFKINCVNPELAAALPHFLVFKMENWPGWEKYPQYNNNELQLSDWFEEFIKFLTNKLDEAINIHYKEIESDKRQDKSVQTQIEQKSYAPYSINVKGSPSLLNTIAFVNINDKDVKLQVHQPLNAECFKKVCLRTLLNWPHAGVHLFSPIFSICRKNTHYYDRHISRDNVGLSPKQPMYIQEVEADQVNITGENIYEIYIKLKKVMSESNSLPSHLNLEVFESLLQQLLLDIDELQILKQGKLSIGSFVRFNIGKHVYTRSKIQSVSQNPVYYNEIIVPMVEIEISKMATADQIKSYLDSLGEPNILLGNLPIFYLSCTFCDVTFHSSQLLLSHFMNIHKMVPPMKCSACKKSFSATELAGSRWTHPCAQNK